MSIKRSILIHLNTQFLWICSSIHGNTTIRYPLPSIFSTVSCKLYAILLTKDKLRTAALPFALILTDSFILNHTPLQHPFVTDTWRQVNITTTNIYIVLVPGYLTFTGNIRADCAAKEVASPVLELHTPSKDFLAVICLCFSQQANAHFAILLQYVKTLVPAWRYFLPHRNSDTLPLTFLYKTNFSLISLLCL